LTGWEQYVAGKVRSEDPSFFPNHAAIRLAGEGGGGGGGAEGLLGGMGGLLSRDVDLGAVGGGSGGVLGVEEMEQLTQV